MPSQARTDGSAHELEQAQPRALDGLRLLPRALADGPKLLKRLACWDRLDGQRAARVSSTPNLLGGQSRWLRPDPISH